MVGDTCGLFGRQALRALNRFLGDRKARTHARGGLFQPPLRNSGLWHLVCQKQNCQGTPGDRNGENMGNLTFWHVVCQKSAGYSSGKGHLTRRRSVVRRSVVPTRKQTKASPTMAEADIAIVRIVPETSFKNKAYEALKEAILKMDIYATPEPVMLDERALSERLGVSRTPIREAMPILQQDGFVKTVPRRGIVVVRRTKSEIADMIRASAALESIAARLITTTARKKDITALRDFFKAFNKDRLPQDHVKEYSKANIAAHQPLA